MFAYGLLAFSLALAIALLAIGISRHVPNALPDASARERERCVSKSRDAACAPCRPTRSVN